jgi:hypothetical protein
MQRSQTSSAVRQQQLGNTPVAKASQRSWSQALHSKPTFSNFYLLKLIQLPIVTVHAGAAAAWGGLHGCAQGAAPNYVP